MAKYLISFPSAALVVPVSAATSRVRVISIFCVVPTVCGGSPNRSISYEEPKR